jgi:hypothetical protein
MDFTLSLDEAGRRCPNPNSLMSILGRGSHTVHILRPCGGLSAEPGADNAPHEARESLILGPIPCLAGLSPIDLANGEPMRGQKWPIQLVRDLCGRDPCIRVQGKSDQIRKFWQSIFDLSFVHVMRGEHMAA